MLVTQNSSPPPLLLFQDEDDDDDSFGEFNFASPPDPSDDWGDFVFTPAGNDVARKTSSPESGKIPANEIPCPPSVKSRDAIPLSLFGLPEPEPEPERDDLITPLPEFSPQNSSKFQQNFSVKSGSIGLQSLIDSLYTQAEKVASIASEDRKELDPVIQYRVSASNGADSRALDSGVLDFGVSELDGFNSRSLDSGVSLFDGVNSKVSDSRVSWSNSKALVSELNSEVFYSGVNSDPPDSAVSGVNSKALGSGMNSEALGSGLKSKAQDSGTSRFEVMDFGASWSNGVNSRVLDSGLSKLDTMNSMVFDSGVSQSRVLRSGVSESGMSLFDGVNSSVMESRAFGSGISGLDAPSVDCNGDLDSEDWEFQDASSSSSKGMLDFLGFYSRLKEETLVMALHRIATLEARRVASVSDSTEMATALDAKIQAAKEKLQWSSKQGSLDQYQLENGYQDMLKIIREPSFQMFEEEFHLSERLSLAKEDLSPAIELFDHAMSMLSIMKLASVVDQPTYLGVWSKMISACAKELRHGAAIWRRALQENVHSLLLAETQGMEYFVALGEVYRVSEILRVSLEVYKPWVLISSSLDMPLHLKECSAAWKESGVREALGNILEHAAVEYVGRIKALLEAIEFIGNMDIVALQNHASREGQFCQLSLLPFNMIPGLEPVVWNGQQYFFLQLANLWANLISPEAPQLPALCCG
ncbi:uncharacterized protein LOC18440859 [Amborella trichopoda]|uniref:Synergin gamma C-terminal domain-containing protein n=1 Tax=Amborella trichopoda TaxID=13333 RepID=W1PYP1_AMBTC|nr:uncharacterized protein LOC18440859 [Amborella trichopoda]ERN12640.1 hypothetical protein AMTR_s00025p00237150 [Amborella trichopoda]|eukprot:XP_006851059.1 uncharacterized protein LOC18440859 [Amborella trichopoda]